MVVMRRSDHVIIATVPARKLIADLAVDTRAKDNEWFSEARKTTNGRKLLHDLEGLLNVIVVTPTGVTSEISLIRLTAGDPTPKPKPVKPKPKPKPKPKEDWNGEIIIKRNQEGDIIGIELKNGDIDSALKILDRIKEALPRDSACILEAAGKGGVVISVEPAKKKAGR